METNPSDFELKQSTIENAGLGVFAKRDLPKGVYLALKPRDIQVGVERHRSEIPEEILKYCVAEENDLYICPADYENMELVWYLNHNSTPNAEPRPEENFNYYALRKIAAGEEILIDYNVFNEPEDKKEDYYKN